MFDIHADQPKNLLMIELRGKFDMEEMNHALETSYKESLKLKKGYGAISDLQDFIPLNEDVRQVLLGGMKKLMDNGLGQVVRISTNAVVSNQWQRSSRSVGYQALVAPDVPSAEKILAELEKPA